MRRFTIISLSLLAVVLAAEVLLRLATPFLPTPLTWYSGWADRKADIAASTQLDPDLLILGDSSAMDGLDPHALSRGTCIDEAFNAAIPAADPVILADWYERLTDTGMAPETVVIGLTSRTVSSQSATRYFDSVAVRDDIFATIERTAAKYSAIVRHRSTLRDPVRLLSHYRNLSSGVDPERWNDLDENGWAQKTTVDDYRSTLGESTGRLTNSETLNKALFELLSSLHDNGTATVVVWMPVTEDWVRTRGGGEESHTQLKDAVRAIAREAGSSFVDLSSDDDPGLFTDPLHLNLMGAEIASNRLAGHLVDFVDCRRSS